MYYFGIPIVELGVGLGLSLGFGFGLGKVFYVTNSDRRVRVGDRVIFTNHIPVIDERLRN